jgi:hypothetical protein
VVVKQKKTIIDPEISFFKLMSSADNEKRQIFKK